MAQVIDRIDFNGLLIELPSNNNGTNNTQSSKIISTTSSGEKEVEELNLNEATTLSNAIKASTPENLSGSVEDLPENIDYYDKITDDGFTPQGYSYVSNDEYQKIFITAYNHDGENSRIYVYDTEGNYEGYIVLNSKNHVGGITYDTDNNIVFVTASNGEVETYDYGALIRAFNLKVINGETTDGGLHLDFDNITDKAEKEKVRADYEAAFIENDISVLEEINENRFFRDTQQGMDSIYYYNGQIYSTTYTGNGELVATVYYVQKDEDGNIMSIKENFSSIVANIGPAVQGISFYEENGETYLVTASSAMGASSLLTKFRRNENGEYEVIGYKEVPREGLEGIYIDKEGNVTGIFEYDKTTENDDNYQIGNINEINNDDQTILASYVDDGTGYEPPKIAHLLSTLETRANLWDAIHGAEMNKELHELYGIPYNSNEN